MLAPDWIVMKATFAFQLLILCITSYTIFLDQFFSKFTALTLLACFCFSSTCCIFILNGICVIVRKPYANIRLLEELRDCDLEIENKLEIMPFQHGIFNRLWQFSRNVYVFCVFRPVYGIFFVVGFVTLSSVSYVLVEIRDRDVQSDLLSACMQLIFPSLSLIAVVILMANSGKYANTPTCKFDYYHPFQEFVETPMSILFRRAFSAVIYGGRLNLFYTMLIFVAVMVSVNFLEHIKNVPEKTLKEPPSSLQLLLSFLLVCCISSGVLLLLHMVFRAYGQAKQSLFAIVEKNWRRNLRAIEYLLPDVNVESLEDLEAALDAKRTEEITDNEKIAFNYLSMPLWQTRRPFVDLTKDFSGKQEKVNLSFEELEAVNILLSQLGSLEKPVQELEEQNGIGTQQENIETSSVPRSKINTRHSRNVSLGNIKPAKITSRRQELVEPCIEEELSLKTTNGESLQDPATEHGSERTNTLPEPLCEPKPEPKRVTRRCEYFK